jgi:hypothetical protein
MSQESPDRFSTRPALTPAPGIPGNGLNSLSRHGINAMHSRTASHVLSVDADELHRIDSIAHDVRDLLIEYLEALERNGGGVCRAPANVVSEIVRDVVDLVYATGEMLADATRQHADGAQR